MLENYDDLDFDIARRLGRRIKECIGKNKDDITANDLLIPSPRDFATQTGPPFEIFSFDEDTFAARDVLERDLEREANENIIAQQLREYLANPPSDSSDSSSFGSQKSLIARDLRAYLEDSDNYSDSSDDD